MSSPDAMDKMIQALGQLPVLNYTAVSLLCILLCECGTVFPREVYSIWHEKWKIINFIYLYCRYVPVLAISLMLAGVTNGVGCGNALITSIWLSFSTLVIAEICFMLRAYALWGASPTAAVFFGFLTVCMIGGLLLDLLLQPLPVMLPTADLKTMLPTLNIPDAMCFMGAKNAMSDFVVVGDVIVLVVDATVVFLVIWAKNKRYNSEVQGANELLGKIYRDSITYFSLNCLLAIVSIVLCMRVPSLAVMTSRVASAFTSIMLCRMIIGLKEIGNKAYISDQVLPASTLSTLRFA